MLFWFSAGLGVLKMAYEAVGRMSGTTPNPQFFLIDKDVCTVVFYILIYIHEGMESGIWDVLVFVFWLQGLITKERSGVDPAASPFAKSIGEVQSIGLQEGSDLLQVVHYISFSKILTAKCYFHFFFLINAHLLELNWYVSFSVTYLLLFLYFNILLSFFFLSCYSCPWSGRFLK